MIDSKKTWIIAAVLILFGAATRLLPHPPNATAITAIALAGAIYLDKKWALLLPISSLLLSDAIIGGYDARLMAVVYLSFAFIGALSWIIRTGERRFLKTAGLTVFSSVFFFITTNTAVWMLSSWYPHTFLGLVESFTMALPFFKNMIAGDILYVSLVIFAFEAVSMTFGLYTPGERKRFLCVAGQKNKYIL